jgi:mRNA interferase MazF
VDNQRATVAAVDSCSSAARTRYHNARNRLLSDIVAIRLTITARDLPTWVKLSAADLLTGYANADCIDQLAKDELREYVGALSPPSMRAVTQALAVALALV